MQSPTKKTPTTFVETHLHLGGDLGLGVRDLDTQLLGARNDVDALPRGNVVGNPKVFCQHPSFLRICIYSRPERPSSEKSRDILSGVGLVVHEQELNIVGVADEERLVAGGHHVTGLLVGTETNL